MCVRDLELVYTPKKTVARVIKQVYGVTRRVRLCLVFFGPFRYSVAVCVPRGGRGTVRIPGGGNDRQRKNIQLKRAGCYRDSLDFRIIGGPAGRKRRKKDWTGRRDARKRDYKRRVAGIKTEEKNDEDRG